MRIEYIKSESENAKSKTVSELLKAQKHFNESLGLSLGLIRLNLLATKDATP